jgi:hypothetical protein
MSSRILNRLVQVAGLAFVPWLACSGAADEELIELPPPPTFGAQCTNGVTVLPSASVAMQCAVVSGNQVSLNLMITDTGSEQVVAAVVDLGFNPPVATFLGCSLGPALGSPAEAQILCGLANNNPAEILVSVVRQGQGPGVTIAGSQRLATLNFQVSSPGSSTLTFLGKNATNGSALLRRNPLDSSQTQIIPGTAFPTGVTIASN